MSCFRRYKAVKEVEALRINGFPVQKSKPMDVSPVCVQTEGFRCLAYRDEKGKWRNYYGGAELKGTVRVIAPYVP
jgi:hypothetical protein